MSKRLIILQILPALNSGGVERGTLEIARALVAAGHRSIVVSNGGRLVEQLVREGSEHITLPVHKKSFSSLFQVRPFRRLLADIKPDIVHARSRVPAWITWLALRRMNPVGRPRFVTTVHGLYSVSPYSAIMTKGEIVIAVSDTVLSYIQQNYPECHPEHIRTIYRGVDPREFPFRYKPSPEWLNQWQQDFPQLSGKQILCLPGRITRLKGHETFISLIATLKSDGLPMHGLIVGGAEEKKQAYLTELQVRIKTLGLEDDITFTGLRSDIREVLTQCHLVLSLSTQPETFGRTVLEALSLGTPVVGWSQGGVGEILRTCYPEGIVKTGDNELLKKTVIHILADNTHHAPIEHFSLDRMCSETLAVYNNLSKQLVAYGDCNTLGFQEQQGKGYPEQVGHALGMKVTNLGHTMSTTREMLAYARDYPPANYKIALVQYGLVDSWLTFRHSPYVLYYPNNFWRKLVRKLIKKIKKYARVFRLQQRWGSIEVVPLEEYLANIRCLITSAPQTSFILIGTSPNLDESRNPRILRYNQALTALASEYENCKYIDAYDEIQARRHELFFSDGTHLNKEGLSILAAKILKQVED